MRYNLLATLGFIAALFSCSSEENEITPNDPQRYEGVSDFVRYADIMANSLSQLAANEDIDNLITTSLSYHKGVKVQELPIDEDADVLMEFLLEGNSSLVSKLNTILREMDVAPETEDPLTKLLAKTYENGANWKVNLNIPFHETVDWNLPFLYSGGLERGSDIVGYEFVNGQPKEIIISEAMAKVRPVVVLIPHLEEEYDMPFNEAVITPVKTQTQVESRNNIVYYNSEVVIREVKETLETLTFLNPNTDIRIVNSHLRDISDGQLTEFDPVYLCATECTPYRESATYKIHKDEVGEIIYRRFWYQFINNSNGAPARWPYFWVTIYEYDWYSTRYKINLLGPDGTYTNVYQKLKSRHVYPRRIYYTTGSANNLLINSNCELYYGRFIENRYIRFAVDID